MEAHFVRNEYLGLFFLQVKIEKTLCVGRIFPHVCGLVPDNKNFLVPLVKLRKANMTFVMSVCPSVHPHETIRLPLDGFSLNLIWGVFSKICLENSAFIKI